MKYLLTQTFLLISSVAFSYYLLNNPNFLPTNDLGEYNWINIFTMIFLISIILFSFFNLLTYLTITIVEKISKKRSTETEENRAEEIKKEKGSEKILKTIKISSFLTLGTLLVFLLNFFHILNWIWGISILIVVLILLFII